MYCEFESIIQQHHHQLVHSFLLGYSKNSNNKVVLSDSSDTDHDNKPAVFPPDDDEKEEVVEDDEEEEHQELSWQERRAVHARIDHAIFLDKKESKQNDNFRAVEQAILPGTRSDRTSRSDQSVDPSSFLAWAMNAPTLFRDPDFEVRKVTPGDGINLAKHQ